MRKISSGTFYAPIEMNALGFHMKTGLFFGSFNPIHNGHFAVARYLRDSGLCREVWFVVSPCNPFKADTLLTDEYERLEIVKAAVAGEPRMRVCDMEFSMPRPSYTADTLRRLKRSYPYRDFAIVMGADNLENIEKWKDKDFVLSEFEIFVYPRPGHDCRNIERRDNIKIVKAAETDISSTDIRRMLSAGEDITPFVPEASKELILKYYSPGDFV